jgi:hypothetical protein
MIIKIIILSRVRPSACPDSTMPICFLDVSHLFCLWDYIRRRSSKFVIHPFLYVSSLTFPVAMDICCHVTNL